MGEMSLGSARTAKRKSVGSCMSHISSWPYQSFFVQLSTKGRAESVGVAPFERIASDVCGSSRSSIDRAKSKKSSLVSSQTPVFSSPNKFFQACNN